jgi:dipeptidyl aminopeptidase/acylaminoacyl peptidase
VAPAGNAAALAELGFIVFLIDALGTPLRDKAFHDAYYANMRDNGLPDHIAAMRQLARRYPQMDLDRVGIFGHSGGGFSSTDAILSYPDFFKVAVSSAGNHDNRSYDYTWGEKYHGLLERNDDGTDSFDSQANQNIADQLEGKLLLLYGTLDDNVHPNATLLVIDELIRNNKDFDLIVMPNRNHGYAGEPYVIRRTWDYFVEHLLGHEPPREYQIIRPGQ